MSTTVTGSVGVFFRAYYAAGGGTQVGAKNLNSATSNERSSLDGQSIRLCSTAMQDRCQILSCHRIIASQSSQDARHPTRLVSGPDHKLPNPH